MMKRKNFTIALLIQTTTTKTGYKKPVPTWGGIETGMLIQQAK